MLPPGARARPTSGASARHIFSYRGLCASSLCLQIPHAPAPTLGGFPPWRNFWFPDLLLFTFWPSVFLATFWENLNGGSQKGA